MTSSDVPQTKAVTLVAPPALLSDEDAARFCGVGVTSFRQAERAGRVGPKPIRGPFGNRRLWSREQLEQWVRQGCPTREQWVAEHDQHSGKQGRPRFANTG